MTKEQIIEILSKYSIVKVWYKNNEPITQEVNISCREQIANEILSLQPTDEIAELKQRISELESELKQIYDKPNINHP